MAELPSQASHLVETKPLSILNVNLGRHHEIAGTERAFLDYGWALESLGQTVTYLVLEKSPLMDFLTSQGKEILTLPRFAFSKTSRKTMASILERLNPHVTLIHERYGNSLVKNLKYKGLFLGVEHNFNKKSYGLYHVHRWIAVSQALKEHWVNLGWPKEHFEVVPNMVTDLPTNQDIPSSLGRPLHRETLTLQEESPQPKKDQALRIGVIGRFSWVKGFDVWIQALALLKSKGIPFHGVIAGERYPSGFSFLKEPIYTFKVYSKGFKTTSQKGLYKSRPRKKLEALLKNLGLEQDISFLGWTPGECFFPNIDILCIPSRQESFGLVFLEGCQWKKPIIASGVGGLKEVGIHQFNAHMVPPQSPEHLAQGLENLILDHSYRKTLAENGKKSLEKYDRKTVGKHILYLIRKNLKELSLPPYAPPSPKGQ